MELEGQLPDEKKIVHDNIKRNKVDLEKHSIQYNSQDLDQEQIVDVNPVQLNTQDIHIYINNNLVNYAGKITGVTYLEQTKEIIENVDITLFFGGTCLQPVYKTNSDKNGNYTIEDIPPGYYFLSAEVNKKARYKSSFIKVLPGQEVNYLIFLV